MTGTTRAWIRRFVSTVALVSAVVALSAFTEAVAKKRKSRDAEAGSTASDPVGSILERKRETYAATIAATAPRPAWQLSLGELGPRSFEDVRALDGGDLLVLIEDGPLLRIDSGAGAVRWRRERPGADTLLTIVATAPVVVVEESSAGAKDDAPRRGVLRRMLSRPAKVGFRGLDSTTGEPRWQLEAPGGSRLLPSGGSERAVLLSPAGDRTTVEPVDLATGARRWRAALAAASFAVDETEALVVPGAVLLAGRAVTRLDDADGRIAWSTPGVGPVRPVASWAARGDSLVLPCRDGSLARVDADGRLVWKLPPDPVPAHVEIHGDLVLVARNDLAARSSSVVAVAFGDGTVRWRRDLDGPMMSAPVVLGSRLLFTHCERPTARNSLQAWDASSGAALAEVELASTGDERSPDFLVPRGEHLAVLQDGGVSAFDLATLRRMWSVPIDWDYPYARLKERAVSELKELVDFEAAMKKAGYLNARSATPAETFDVVFAGPRADLWLDAASRNAAAVYAATRSTLSDPSSGSLERRIAHQERALAIDRQIVTARVGQAMDRAQATVGFTFAVWDAIFAMQRGRAMATLGDLREDAFEALWFLERAANRHAAGIQGDYYVHPVLHWPDTKSSDPVDAAHWYGYLVVDLRSGKWAKVATSPESQLLYFSPSLSDLREAERQWVTIDRTGTRLISRGIGLDPAGWNRVETGGRVAPSGTLLAIPLDAVAFHDAGEPAAAAGFGYVDRSGAFVVPPRYAVAKPFSEGLAVVGREEQQGFIDREGNAVVVPQYLEANPMSGGVSAVKTRDGWIYVDGGGANAFPGKTFETAFRFVDGFAGVCPEDGRCGFLSRDGSFLVPPEYDNAYDFSEGVGCVRERRPRKMTDRYVCFDAGGNVVLESDGYNLYSASYRDGLISFRKRSALKESGIGFLDRRGDVAIRPNLANVRDFSEGRAAFSPDEGFFGKWGFLDRTGAVVIAPQYDFVSSFSEGLAAAKRGDLWGYIDDRGTVVIDFRFKSAKPFSEGLAAVSVDEDYLRGQPGIAEPTRKELFGYVDHDGTFVIPPRFRDARPFSEGLAAAVPAD